MRLPHLFHNDPNWRIIGVHAYHQCRCGARRVNRVVANLHGPVATGWPPLVDRHGRELWNTGWVKPPPGGWTHDGRDEQRPRPSPSIPAPPARRRSAS